MNSEPLWHREENGTYGLLFPNKQAISLEEIREIFSEFGTVCNINTAGDERGFRFVQLQHEHEAERAVIGLKDHPTVKLIPYRPKKRKTNEPFSNVNEPHNQHQSSHSDNYQRNFFRRRSPNEPPGVAAHNNTSRSCLTKPDDDELWDGKNEDSFPDRMQSEKDHMGNAHNNVRNYGARRSQNSQCDNGDMPWGRNDEENFSDNASLCSNTSSRKYRNLSNKDSCAGNSSNHRPPISNSANRILPQMATLSLTNTMPMSPRVETDRLLKVRGVVADTFSLNKNDQASNPFDTHSEDCGEIPSLVRNSDLSVCNDSKRRVIEAGEIIVANIPEDYGSAYMLHLFEQYEPIAISYIMKIQNCGIRYCHVFFKSKEDSLEVERNFDQLILSGKKLIVLRASTIIREGRL